MKFESFFNVNNVSSTNDDNLTRQNQTKITLPLILFEQQAIHLIEKKLDRLNYEKLLFQFTLPIHYMFLKVNQVIKFIDGNQHILMRILAINIIGKRLIKIFAINHYSGNDDSIHYT